MSFKPYCIEDLGTSEVVMVSPETTLMECAKRMHDQRVRSLVVASRDDDSEMQIVPEGILTDRDIVVEAVAFALDPKVITAGDIMTCPLVTARLDESLQEVYAGKRTFCDRGVRCLGCLGGLAGSRAAACRVAT
jgi:CBS domain-containing protein